MSRKRTRPQTDVDGEGSENTQNKKRRLSLELMTSRLSRPYATPSTHIINRKPVKTGPWTRRDFSGKNLLRRAAILNSMRIKKEDVAKKTRQRRPDAPAARYMDERPQKSSPIPLEERSSPPLSNSPPRKPGKGPLEHRSPSEFKEYEIFDYEDSIFEDHEDDGDGESVYSDLSCLQASDPNIDTSSPSYSFDTLDFYDDDPRPATEPEKKIRDFLLESEKQVEVSIAPYA